jgi:hypothetical protein
LLALQESNLPQQVSHALGIGKSQIGIPEISIAIASQAGKYLLS